MLCKDSIKQNDVNLTNAMLSADRQPILIDFDSCQPLGSRMGVKCGSPDWSNGSDLSEEINDLFGLKKMVTWLADQLKQTARNTSD